MSEPTGSLSTVVFRPLVGTLLAALVVGQLATASPLAAAGPPSSPPGGGVPGIELVDGVGNGGQPEDLPREIVIDGARFLFDRVVRLSRQELVRVAQERE